MAKVKDYPWILWFLKGIPVKSCPPCRCKFRPDIMVFQNNGIVSRRSNLAFMIKPWSVSIIRIFEWTRNRLQFVSGGWHQQDITAIHHTHTAPVRMAETHNRVFRIVISWCKGPSLIINIRAKVYHCEGQWCARKCMTEEICSDKRINIVNRIFFLCSNPDSCSSN